MKKTLIFVALCMALTSANAQDKKDTVLVHNSDSIGLYKKSIVVNIGPIQVVKNDSSKLAVKPKDKLKLHFTATRFDFGISTYLDNGSFTLSPANSFLERNNSKSTNFAFDFLEMGYRFNKNFKIYTAAGFDWTHMRLKQNITIQKSAPTLSYVTESV